MNLDTKNKQPQIVFDTNQKSNIHKEVINSQFQEMMNTGLDISNKNISSVTTITQPELDQQLKNNKQVHIPTDSIQPVNIEFIDKFKQQKQIIQEKIQQTNTNIFKKDQIQTQNKDYSIFQSNEKIEFNEEFIKYLENNYTNNGIYIDCSFLVPETTDQDMNTYIININMPLCIANIFDNKTFSIVTNTKETKLRMNDPSMKDIYHQNLEQRSLLTKIL